MSAAQHRLSRPVYEGLPWAYVLAGLLALIASYFQTSSALSMLLGLPGFVGLLAGVVVLLRRRAYRRLRAQYDAPEALAEAAAGLPLGPAVPDTPATHRSGLTWPYLERCTARPPAAFSLAAGSSTLATAGSMRDSVWP